MGCWVSLDHAKCFLAASGIWALDGPGRADGQGPRRDAVQPPSRKTRLLAMVYPSPAYDGYKC